MKRQKIRMKNRPDWWKYVIEGNWRKWFNLKHREARTSKKMISKTTSMVYFQRRDKNADNDN